MATKRNSISDGKHKEILQKEEDAKEIWTRRWTDLSTREFYENAIKEVSLKLGHDANYYFDRVQKKKDSKKAKSWFDVKPSPKFPERSSQLVGWRSGAEYSLEIAGPFFISDRDTVTPEGREPPDKYDFTVLG